MTIQRSAHQEDEPVFLESRLVAMVIVVHHPLVLNTLHLGFSYREWSLIGGCPHLLNIGLRKSILSHISVASYSLQPFWFYDAAAPFGGCPSPFPTGLCKLYLQQQTELIINSGTEGMFLRFFLISVFSNLNSSYSLILSNVFSLQILGYGYVIRVNGFHVPNGANNNKRSGWHNL